MAELLAASSALGVASSLITFGDVAWRVLKRCEEYNRRTTEIPAVIRHIAAQLPIIIEKVQKLRISTKDGSLITPKSSLAVAIVGCDQAIGRLELLAKKVMPLDDESKWRLTKRAIRSVKYEKDIGSNWTILQSYVSTFTFHLAEMKDAIECTDNSPVGPTFTVPFERDKHFVGRQRLIEEIKAKFQSRNRIALAGIGGIGKSQIAIEYCFRFKEDNPDCHVFWVHASNTNRFQQAHSDIARRLRIPGWDDPKPDTMQIVYEWLRDCKTRWMMVLDNADTDDIFAHSASSADEEESTKPLMDYIPINANGSILITTRDRRVGDTFALGEPSIVVDHLHDDEAQSMLSLKIPTTAWSDAASFALMNELDHLPLAITQAASFIRQNLITIEAYLSILQTEDTQLKTLLELEHADSRRDNRSQNSVARTWKVSFDYISRQDTYASELLCLVVMFDRHCVPTSLLRDDGRNIVKFTRALGTLQAYSLIRPESKGSGFAVHRLVQLSVQIWLKSKKWLTDYQQKALTVMKEQLSCGGFDDWKICEALMPHAQAAVDQACKTPSLDLDRAEILSRIALHEQEQGRYGTCAEQKKTILEIYKQSLGEEHLDTLATMNDLASAYNELGQYSKALTIQVEILETYHRVSGPEDPSTLAVMGNLSLTYNAQGRHEEASTLGLETLTRCQRAFEQNHPDTVKTMNNLALIWSDQGRYEKAGELAHQAWQISKRTLGSEHFCTLVNMDNLATILFNQGKYDDAAEMHDTIVNIRKRVLRPRHPETLRSMNNLAVVYLAQGQHEKAFMIELEVVESQIAELGQQHPESLTAINNLALSHSYLGQQGKAVILQEEVLQSRKDTLGPEHPETIASVCNLAFTYYNLDRYDEAILLGAQAVEACNRVLGKHQPLTGAAMSNLALTYSSRAQYDESVELRSEAIEIRKQVLGQDHPDTIHSITSLEAVKSHRDRSNEATVH